MDSLEKHQQGALQVTENNLRSHASDIYSDYQKEVTMKSATVISFRPTHTSDPYEFKIVPKAYNYVIPQATRLGVKLKVVKGNGENLTAADNVAPVNMLASSLWKTIQVEIAGVPLTPMQNEYANYKAYIENQLSYGLDARKTHLTTYLASQDTAGHFDDTKNTTYVDGAYTIKNDNVGFDDRKREIELSRSVFLKTPLHCDFLQSERSFPQGMAFTITLIKAPDAFLLMTNSATEKYKVVIEDIRLYIRFVEMHDEIVREHHLLSQRVPAVMTMNKTTIRTHLYAANTQDLRVENLFQGHCLPKSLIIGMVGQDAFNGHYNKNPYNFQHFGVQSAAITMFGKLIPNEPYTPNFGIANSNDYMMMYRDMFDNIGILNNDFGNVITPNLFKGGMFFMAFDFSPDQCNGYHMHDANDSNINLEMMLTQPSTETIVLIAFAVYNTILRIDNTFAAEVVLT